MDKDELARQLESISGTLQYQVLNNFDSVVAQCVKEGHLSKSDLETMVKRPIMQVVTKIKSLRLTTQNPGLGATQKENNQ